MRKTTKPEPKKMINVRPLIILSIMKLTIFKKLMLSFIGLTIIVLIATLSLARWSFEYGFLNYINTLEQARLQPLAEQIAEEYLAAGESWDKLTQHHFNTLLKANLPKGRGGLPPIEPHARPKKNLHFITSRHHQEGAPMGGVDMHHRPRYLTWTEK